MGASLNISDGSKILIVAPHPDDETIGCGGVLALYGAQCDVLLLTDGRLGKPEGQNYTEQQTADMRHKEFENVMRFFGVNRWWELRIPDQQFSYYSDAISNVDLRIYDYIFVPNRNERHPDHKAAYAAMKKLYKKQRAKGLLMEYEVWSPIIEANIFLDISKVMNIKTEGLLKYKTQIASIDYDVLARGLNMYRGAPHHVEFCEAFYSDRLARVLKRQILWMKLPYRLRNSLISLKNSINWR